MAIEKEIYFLIGCPRSGSTFFNHILRDYLDMGFANELQLIPKYYRKLNSYGDLSANKNLHRLIGDIYQEPYFSLFENAYSKKLGKHVQIRKQDIISNLPESSFAGIIYSVLKVTANEIGKTKIGNKHLIMGIYPEFLDQLFPKSKIIHLIRDGRDCALSLMRMRWGHANIYASARFWAQTILRPRNYKKLQDPNRYMELRYEDFMQNPVVEMDRVRRFVGENEKNHKSSEELFGELRELLKPNNIYKWKYKMTQNDIAIFQYVAGNVLSECGYEIGAKSAKVNILEKWCYLIHNQVLREYKVRFRKDMPS